MCKTNPIRGDAGGTRPQGRRTRGKCAKRSQFHQPERGPWGEGRTCETNPIPTRQDSPAFHYSIIPPFQSDADCAKRTQFPAVPGGTRPQARGTRGKCAKRSQFGRVSGGDAQPTKSRLRQTKPNLGGLGHVGKGGHRKWNGFAGTWNVGNKPNFPEPVRVTSAFERKGYGNFRRSVDREEQSQFRPTGPCDSRSIGGSRTRTPNPRSGRGQAPRRAGRIERAKRTQFGQAGRRVGSVEGEMCETNPICTAGGRSRARTPDLRRVGGGPIVRNKANSWSQTASMDRAFAVVCRPHPRRPTRGINC
jgi:hypothetical protein